MGPRALRRTVALVGPLLVLAAIVAAWRWTRYRAIELPSLPSLPAPPPPRPIRPIPVPGCVGATDADWRALVALLDQDAALDHEHRRLLVDPEPDLARGVYRALAVLEDQNSGESLGVAGFTSTPGLNTPTRPGELTVDLLDLSRSGVRSALPEAAARELATNCVVPKTRGTGPRVGLIVCDTGLFRALSKAIDDFDPARFLRSWTWAAARQTLVVMWSDRIQKELKREGPFRADAPALEEVARIAGPSLDGLATRRGRAALLGAALAFVLLHELDHVLRPLPPGEPASGCDEFGDASARQRFAQLQSAEALADSRGGNSLVLNESLCEQPNWSCVEPDITDRVGVALALEVLYHSRRASARECPSGREMPMPRSLGARWDTIGFLVEGTASLSQLSASLFPATHPDPVRRVLELGGANPVGMAFGDSDPGLDAVRTYALAKATYCGVRPAEVRLETREAAQLRARRGIVGLLRQILDLRRQFERVRYDLEAAGDSETGLRAGLEATLRLMTSSGVAQDVRAPLETTDGDTAPYLEVWRLVEHVAWILRGAAVSLDGTDAFFEGGCAELIACQRPCLSHELALVESMLAQAGNIALARLASLTGDGGVVQDLIFFGAPDALTLIDRRSPLLTIPEAPPQCRRSIRDRLCLADVEGDAAWGTLTKRLESCRAPNPVLLGYAFDVAAERRSKHPDPQPGTWARQFGVGLDTPGYLGAAWLQWWLRDAQHSDDPSTLGTRIRQANEALPGRIIPRAAALIEEMNAAAGASTSIQAWTSMADRADSILRDYPANSSLWVVWAVANLGAGRFDTAAERLAVAPRLDDAEMRIAIAAGLGVGHVADTHDRSRRRAQGRIAAALRPPVALINFLLALATPGDPDYDFIYDEATYLLAGGFRNLFDEPVDESKRVPPLFGALILGSDPATFGDSFEAVFGSVPPGRWMHGTPRLVPVPDGVTGGLISTCGDHLVQSCDDLASCQVGQPFHGYTFMPWKAQALMSLVQMTVGDDKDRTAFPAAKATGAYRTMFAEVVLPSPDIYVLSTAPMLWGVGTTKRLCLTVGPHPSSFHP